MKEGIEEGCVWWRSFKIAGFVCRQEALLYTFTSTRREIVWEFLDFQGFSKLSKFFRAVSTHPVCYRVILVEPTR